MKTINSLNEAVNKVAELAEQLQRENFDEVLDKGPIIVHQRLCAKLVEVSKENPQKIPEMVKITDAIDLVEQLFPHVKI